MSKVLFAFVTFGNPEFSEACVNSVKETAEAVVDFFTVVGKPMDAKTKLWLSKNPEIAFIEHKENKGFPASINDIFDYAWKHHDYDYVILAGNDTIVYPFCIDSLIQFADTTEYECVNALQYDVRDLNLEYPESRQYFKGDKKLFYDFGAKPWEMFKGYSKEPKVMDMQLMDIQNMCLYKRAVFEKIGYADVNFYPAYFVDNDYARRMAEYPIKSCTLANARFFHFWSRVIHQGSGGSNSKFFEENERYYKTKWGGEFGKETKMATLKIDSRDNEDNIISMWRNKQ